MQLILNNQIGRQQPFARYLRACWRIARTIESIAVIALDAPEKSANPTDPRKRGALIDGCNEKARKAAVDRFIHRDNRQRHAATEGARAICAGDAEVGRLVTVWQQAKGNGFELLSASRTIFEWNGRRFSVVAQEADRSGTGGLLIVIALSAHSVGCGCATDPQANLERPITQFYGVFLPLQFESADEGGCPAELIECEEAERGSASAHSTRQSEYRDCAAGAEPR